MFRVLSILFSLATIVVAQRVMQPDSPARSGSTAAEFELPDASALGALALLPKDVAARVARVEGPAGHPFPDRWYVLVHDSTLATGLREYVFAEGKAVANRGLSQFANSVSEDEVIGAAAVRVNSSEAAGIAAQFTMHNGQLLGELRYELLKLDGVPVWRLTCSAADGEPLGTVILHATNGSVVSFEGFERSPVQGDGPAAPLSAAVETEPLAPAAAERATRVSSTKSSKPRPKARVRTASRRTSSSGPIDRVGKFFKNVFR